MVRKAARKASPISACTIACRAGASVASASGPCSIMVPNRIAVSRSLRRENRKQDRGDRSGAEGGADRARKLHGGCAASPRLPRPRRGLNRDLHDAHHRSHEQPVIPQQREPCEQCRTEAPEPKSARHDRRLAVTSAEEAEHGGKTVVRPVLLDKPAGEQRTGSDPDRQRDQQQAGIARRKKSRTTLR